jgi:isocitrate dehydrogenase (NAD+)
MANPVSMLLSAVFMLRHLGLTEYADRIHDAVMETLSSGQVNDHR